MNLRLSNLQTQVVKLTALTLNSVSWHHHSGDTPHWLAPPPHLIPLKTTE